MTGDARLRGALGYKRFTDTPKILVFESDYLVTRDVLAGAKKLGWTTYSVSTKKEGTADGTFVGNLLKTMVASKPDFILTINHIGFDENGILAALLAKYDIPVASWFVDHPLPVIGGAKQSATPFTQVFSFERTALDWLAQEGFEDPIYLPTGTNQTVFNPDNFNDDKAKKLAHPLTFVGNSWWPKARVEPPLWARKAVKKLQKGGPIDATALNTDLIERIEKLKLKLPNERAKYMIAQVGFAESSMQTRGRFAKALAPVGLRIHGDSYWRELVTGVKPAPVVDYETELPTLYKVSDINANISAEQMPTALNQRVWDVPAAGGFLLTDAQEDALEYFKDGLDIALYKNLEEAADKARYYLAHPEKRASIANLGREKVLKDHCITHRLKSIVEVMRKRFS